MDLEKIKRLQAQASAAKKGSSVHRKPVRAAAAGSGDDKKLSASLKKLGVQPIAGLEEVNMFQEDGTVLHFSAPKVHAAVNANTYAIYGNGQQKDLTELVPGILSQLGPDSLASLRRMAEQYNANAGRNTGKEKEPDDDDVPALVDTFEVDESKDGSQAAPTSTNKLEELE